MNLTVSFLGGVAILLTRWSPLRLSLLITYLKSPPHPLGLIMSLNTSPGCGHYQCYGIKIYVVLIQAELIWKCLNLWNTKLQNHWAICSLWVSQRVHVFPAKLKLSKTIPIFKAGDHACCDNYRQISLLSSISKVFEKIVANTFVNHLEINKLLCDNQYGFLRERSTVHNITKLTRKISHDLKGIVSRDWGGLQMILLDRLEVFIISASGFYLFLSTFSYRIF